MSSTSSSAEFIRVNAATLTGAAAFLRYLHASPAVREAAGRDASDEMARHASDLDRAAMDGAQALKVAGFVDLPARPVPVFVPVGRRPMAAKALTHLQLVAVCQALTNTAGYADLWSDNGPSENAAPLREAMRAGCTSGVVAPYESLLVRLAWDLWDGSGGVTFAEALEYLGRERLLDVVRLVGAISQGSSGVGLWLAAQGVRNG